MQNYILPTYARFPVTFVRGEGCRLWDENGKEYVDFMSGIGVNAVGHAHPKWIGAIVAQTCELVHTSNLYQTLPGAELAARLCKISGMSGAFFFERVARDSGK